MIARILSYAKAFVAFVITVVGGSLTLIPSGDLRDWLTVTALPVVIAFSVWLTKNAPIIEQSVGELGAVIHPDDEPGKHEAQ